ncbi:MAG: cytochrome c [Flavobacteriaceae bacterium]|nr:cytochrome c [Flavobacteriaceae bacterium]
MRFYQQKTLEQSMADGAEIYADFCVQCHLQTGAGVSGVFPPLNQSDYLFEDLDRSIRGVKYGLKGNIVVNDETYAGIMASQGLDDEEIADVMNYILNSWDNSSEIQISPERVANIVK